MARLTGRDPITTDIINAVKVGHFDRIREDGPSVLAMKSVDELLLEVGTMSRDRRRNHLAQMGRVLGERAGLSGGKRSKRTRLWLSR